MKSGKTTFPLSLILAATVFLAGCDTSKPSGPKSDDYADLSIVVRDEFGRPVAGGKLTTNPPTEEVLTDSEGRAVFRNIPVRTYTLYLRRTGFPTYNMNVTPEPKDGKEVVFVIPTEQPDPRILFPPDGSFVSMYEVRFAGTGTDAEDGVLPDSLLVWHSSIDGEIGRGKELLLDSLSPGNHEITLQAIDFDHKKGEVSININVLDYNPHTYFPMPVGASWVYTHQTQKFSVTNTSGDIETWILYNIEVEIDRNRVRTSKMIYKMEDPTRIREYHYTVSDYLEQEGNEIRVTKTKENLKVWNGNSFGNPSNELELETRYEPSYTLLKNALDPAAGGSYENRIHITVTWLYNDPYYKKKEFSESFYITSRASIGEEMTVTTTKDEYRAVPVTLVDGTEKNPSGSVRTWYLAKGLGIVKMKYNTFKMPPVAVLLNTNLANMSAKESLSRTTVSESASQGAAMPLLEPLPAEEGPERMKRIRNLLHRLVP